MTKPLTPTEQRVLLLIERAARAGREAPSNDVLAGAIGAASDSTASSIVARLERKGVISVVRFQSGREITIVGTGLVTAFHGARTLHWRDQAAAGARPAPAALPRQSSSPASIVRAEPSTPDVEHLRLTVDRDPCPKCGVRGDIGCRHTGGPRLHWGAAHG